MSDLGVLHHRRAPRFDAASYRSIRASSRAGNETFSTRIAAPPTCCTCLGHRRDERLTSAPTRAQAPRRTAAAAKIPIPS
jgi:hypothetical protein